MPRNFSFLEAGRLAAMERPGSSAPLAKDLDFLRQHGIGAIVSLTLEPPDPELLARHGFAALHLPVADFTAPTPEQIARFLDFVAERERRRAGAVVVHCDAGRGRSGTLLACWLVSRRNLPAAEAIAAVRRLRPASIETAAQEEAIHAFARRGQAARERANGQEAAP
jgi:atypical dual specificity phosphatase